jgi:hypothetical protein
MITYREGTYFFFAPAFFAGAFFAAGFLAVVFDFALVAITAPFSSGQWQTKAAGD